VKSAKKDISRLFRSVLGWSEEFLKRIFKNYKVISLMKGKKLYLNFPTTRQHKCLKTISSNAGSD
jgi:hypothetical protein